MSGLDVIEQLAAEHARGQRRNRRDELAIYALAVLAGIAALVAGVL